MHLLTPIYIACNEAFDMRTGHSGDSYGTDGSDQTRIYDQVDIAATRSVYDIPVKRSL